MSEKNAERAPQIRRVEAEEVRKSLDSSEVAPPIPVEVPAPSPPAAPPIPVEVPAPSPPAAPPQDTAPADFDG